jgi:hypothetical protein
MKVPLDFKTLIIDWHIAEQSSTVFLFGLLQQPSSVTRASMVALSKTISKELSGNSFKSLTLLTTHLLDEGYFCYIF